MKRLFSLASVMCLVGCGSHGNDEPPQPTAPTEAPAPKPGPGVDLAGPISLPERRGPTHAGAAAPAMLDLAADRAVVPVSVPRPPQGGSVGFSFADDKSGWVARIPGNVQLPAVAYGAGKVYVSGGFESVSFYAMDAESGKIEWATTQLEDNGPTAAVYEDDRVLFNTESCTLFALDAKTGKRLWFRRIGDPTLAQIAVADGLVYASHPDADGQVLTAYKVKTGEPVWSRSIGAELLAAPVISGDSVYVSTIGGYTYRFARATGTQRWAKPLHATTAPWIVDNDLFVTRRKADKEQQIVVAADTGEVIREHRSSSGKYVDDVPQLEAEPKTVWAFEGSRSVVDRGVRYVAMGGEIHASDASTGEPLWDRRYAGAKQDRRSVGSVAVAGSQVVIATRDGKLFGLDVDTGYTLWSYDIGHNVVAEPIVAKGWVYSTTDDGYVVALNVGDKTLDGWHMFGGNARHDGLVTPEPPRGVETPQLAAPRT
jgi:Ca-activated chloride channel family protein